MSPNRLLRLSSAASLLVIAAALPLAAQGSTTVWTMQSTVPDSLRAMTMGVGEFDMRLTLATDGKQVGVQLEPGPALQAAAPGMDLSGTQLQVILPAAGDSIRLGVVLPPEIAAQMGGGIGWHLSFAVPDSVNPDDFHADSIAAAQAEFRGTTSRTGKRDVVAGIPCEEWLVTPPADSTGMQPSSILLCVADSLPAVAALTTALESHLARVGVDFDQWTQHSFDTFGNRDAAVVRAIVSGPAAVTVQLMSATDTAPDASFFELPPGLEPFPPELMAMFKQGANQNEGGEQ